VHGIAFASAQAEQRDLVTYAWKEPSHPGPHPNAACAPGEAVHAESPALPGVHPVIPRGKLGRE
jgi:hypothetical protein